jgi:hypothetical protein
MWRCGNCPLAAAMRLPVSLIAVAMIALGNFVKADEGEKLVHLVNDCIALLSDLASAGLQFDFRFQPNATSVQALLRSCLLFTLINRE